MNAADAGIGNAVMCIMHHATGVSSHYGTGGNSFQIGIPNTIGSQHCNGGFISPPEAFALDSKIDDGVGYTGYFYTFRSSQFNTTPNCMSQAQNVLPSVATSEYELDVSEPTCRVYYWLDKG